MYKLVCLCFVGVAAIIILAYMSCVLCVCVHWHLSLTSVGALLTLS